MAEGLELQTAIALVSSSADPKVFGTGFVVHQDQEFSYLVTCAHVLRDIEKQAGAQIVAGGLAARVVARGEPDEVDLAVLAVPRWRDRSPMILATGAATGAAVRVLGHCSREEKSALLREEQRGELAKAAQLTGRRSGEAVGGWYLSFGGGDRLEPGYSGGPVVCGDWVVAVAAIKLGEGRAIAIGIEALAKIWLESSEHIFASCKQLTITNNLQGSNYKSINHLPLGKSDFISAQKDICELKSVIYKTLLETEDRSISIDDSEKAISTLSKLEEMLSTIRSILK